MDDLRAALGAFDPDAPLDAAPDPWDYLPMPVVRAAPPWAMAEMVAAEPALAARIGRGVVVDGSADALALALRATAASGGPVVVTGCGTSEHAAMGVAAILGDAWRAAGLAGPGPFAAQAFELAQEPPAGGLVIGISHEGGTAATIAAMDAARARGAAIAVITGSAASPAGTAADVVVSTVEMDRSWCHTVGYVSPLAAASAVADVLTGAAPQPGALAQRVRQGIDAAWAPDPDGVRPAAAIGRTIGDASHLLVVASGVDRVTARELVLKVEEAAWVPSAMRDLETFLHGHLPATGASTGLVLILADPAGREARIERARQALAAARVVGLRAAAIVSTEVDAALPAELTPAGRLVVDEAPDLAPPLAALLGTATPLQLLTERIARVRGTNPDLIRRDDAVYREAADAASS